MHPLLKFWFLGLGVFVKVINGRNLTDLIPADIPECAAQCLTVAIVDSGCDLANKTCVCSTASLGTQAIDCIDANCTIKQALVSRNATETNCGSTIRERTADYVPLHHALGALSSVFVLQRFAFKLYTGLRVELDDCFALLTMLVSIPTTIIAIYLMPFCGLGRDIWTVSFDDITEYSKLFYILSLLYSSQLPLLKFSLLFFYLRIFPSNSVRRVLWGTIAFNAVWGIVYIFVISFQCTPTCLAWERWHGEYKGTCMNMNALAWSQSTISIILDFWMLAIPMSQIRLLHLDWKKKIGAGVMFVVGSFVTAMSIIRLKSLRRFATSAPNPTMDFVDTLNWSTTEIQVGIICTCLPVSRLLMIRLFPRVFGTSHGSRADDYSAGGGTDRRRQSVKKLNHSKQSIHFSQSGPYSNGSNRKAGVGWDNDEIELVGTGGENEGSTKSAISV